MNYWSQFGIMTHAQVTGKTHEIKVARTLEIEVDDIFVFDRAMID